MGEMVQAPFTTLSFSNLFEISNMFRYSVKCLELSHIASLAPVNTKHVEVLNICLNKIIATLRLNM